MSHTTENNILLYLTGKQTAEDVSVDELIELTKQYPAFGVAKLMLAKKTQQEGHPDSNKYAQNAVLHFPNPYWFHFKLNEEELMKGETLSLQETTPRNIYAAPVEETMAAGDIVADTENGPPAGGAIEPATEAGINQEEDKPVAVEEEQPAENEGQQPADDIAEKETEEVTNRQEHEPVAVREEPHTETEYQQPTDDTTEMESAEAANPPESEPVAVEEEQPAETEGQQPPGDIAEMETEEAANRQEHEPVAVEEEPPAENEQPAGNIIEMETGDTAMPGQEEPVENTIPPGLSLSEMEEPEDVNDTDGFEDADAENEAFMPTLGNNKISSVLQEQLEEFKKPVTENTPVPIESEPYHTVDYFASQGIKLSAEQQKEDHLAVKVKKFTDWLKQMKRISPAPADLGIDEAAEHKVQDSAATSNEPKEVVTEAMAEVLAMQGMTEKAIQVYIKLSFLDPSKTAYFASKIEKLKGI